MANVSCFDSKELAKMAKGLAKERGGKLVSWHIMVTNYFTSLVVVSLLPDGSDDSYSMVL